MAREEIQDPTPLTRNFQGLERIRLRDRMLRTFVNASQGFERADHLLTAGVARASRVGAEFALSREPADDNRAQQHKDKLKQMNQDVLEEIVPTALIIDRKSTRLNSSHRCISYA